MPSRESLLVLLVACLTLTAGCSFFATNPESLSSSYEYSVGLDANETLQNVTIRVPLPLIDGTPAVDESDIAPNGTLDAEFDSSTRGTNRTATERFDASVVDTEHGPMLELTAERFTVETRYVRYVEEDGMGRQEEISESEYDPENPDHAKRDTRTVSATLTLDATYPIETRDPVGVSPTLYGDSVTRELADCQPPYRDEAACFDYDAPVYLSYETTDGAQVDTTTSFYGSNEWFTGGWTGNSYRDRTHSRATGPQNGWVTADGDIETGVGNYPSPEA